MTPATEDTVAAIVTPTGAGGLGVVRLSGPEALRAASRLFRPSLEGAPTHTLRHGAVVDGDEIVDDAVASVFRAPRSYTGEDVVELSCHGNTALLRRVMALCLKAGARPAGPGEFTKRAFLNGKMDLAQAEAVASLITARSDAARRWALDQLRGGLSSRLEDLRKKILSLLAHLEANMDFVEDEVPDLARGELRRRLEALREEFSALLATAPRGRLYRDGLRVALAGRPNVGKSSLFNALLGTDRAIVTDLPGTTRDTLEETFIADGLPVTLTDTAGLRESAGRVEAEGIARARRALAEADVVLWTVDAADPFTPEDMEAARALAGKPVLLALNKSDTLPPGRDRIPMARPPADRALFTSAVTGEGLPELRRLFAETALPAARGDVAGPTIINDRHEARIRDAEAALSSAADAAGKGDPDECLALELRRALEALKQVEGRNVSDEVLDAVFSRFCIGK